MRLLAFILFFLPFVGFSQALFYENDSINENNTSVQYENNTGERFFAGINLTGAGVVAPPAETCADGILNNGETEIDCGGPNCQPCEVLPTCSDGIQNGDETGVDCGGSCDPCGFEYSPLVVPSARMDELIFYATGEEQTGADGTFITTVTDLSKNPVSTSVSNLLINVASDGSREFDFGLGVGSHPGASNPVVPEEDRVPAHFRWDDVSKFSTLNPLVDELTIIIVTGERLSTSVGSYLFKGIYSQSGGVFQIINSGDGCGFLCTTPANTGAYIEAFQNPPGHGMVFKPNKALFNPNETIEVVVTTNGVTSTSTTYFSGVQAVSIPNPPNWNPLVNTNPQNPNEPWVVGSEYWPNNIQGPYPWQFNGTIKAVMIFNEALTTQQIADIRNEYLGVPTCNDGIQNGDETGVDCGGSCSPCNAPTCSDGIQNGDETGVDCGGSCSPCPTCSDGVQNGDETGVDCGGSCAPCVVDPATCFDGIQNGTETGVDCGGSCPPCDVPDAGLWFPSGPQGIEPATTESYTPTSAIDVSNPANAGRRAIITNSFDCTGCTWAANQVIDPNGGQISGTSINLNGAYIREEPVRAFSPSARFSSIYADSFVHIETFGGVSNDNIDDTPAIDALLNNVQYAINSANGLYIKNSASDISRTGYFIWNLNNSKVEITAGETYSSTTETAMFSFFQTNVKMYNGEFDLNNRHSIFVWAGVQEGFHYENLWIHDLDNGSSTALRTVAFRIELNTAAGTKIWRGRSTTQRTQNGYFRNCHIENLRANGTFLPNYSSQGIWYQLRDIDPAWNALIYHEGNVINNITGVEAEGMYLDEYTWWNNKIITNNTRFEFQRDSIYDCEDRAMKSVVSNVTVNNGYYGSINPAIRTPQGGAIINFFTLRDNNNLAGTVNDRSENIVVTNNTFDSPYGSRQQQLSLTNVRDVFISGNTFQSTNTGNYPAIMLGVFFPQGSIYPLGEIENFLITGNTYTNLGIEYNQECTPTNLVIDGETFNWNFTGSGAFAQGIFRYNGFLATTDVRGGTIRNCVANVTTSISGFDGWFASRANNHYNMRWENNTLNYTNPYSASTGAEFMYMRGNFDSSNQVTNCNMTNASGTGSLRVDGTRTVIITNSFGNGVPITVQ